MGTLRTTFRSMRRTFFMICRRVLDLFLHFTFRTLHFGRKEELPPIDDLLLLQPATSLAAKIRKKQLSSVDLVKAYMARIRDVQPFINAIAEERMELALKEAIQADKLVASGTKTEDEIAKETPFLGVPMSVKEAIAVKGQPFTAGLLSRKGIVAEKDAHAVHLMKQVGAIPVASTNISELCMWWESYNYVYGRCNNPYDTGRIPGGSSGGEGALLAAAGSVIGIGSDIGGSIRMPAFFNGIFGHKPTTGIVSNNGTYPPPEKKLNGFQCVGPMCRYATDLLPMLKVMAGSNSLQLKLETRVRLESLKIYYMDSDGGNPHISKIHPDMVKAMGKVLQHFENAYKIKPERLELKSLKHAFYMWAAKMRNSGAPSFASEMGERKHEVNCMLEFLEWIVGLSNFTLPAILLAFTEKCIPDEDSEETERYFNMCSDLQRELQSYLKDDGIFLFPSHPEPAPHHNEPIFKPFNFVYTAIFNVLGFPVTQCPLGLGQDGLPVGVQVVSNLNNDHLTLAVAVELEKTFGGWIPPCAVAS